MEHVVIFKSDRGPVFIEVAKSSLPASSLVKAGRGDAIRGYVEQAAASFEDALATALSAADAFVARAADLARAPDEMEVEFGLKLGGELNAFVVTCDAEANFTIKLVWKKAG